MHEGDTSTHAAERGLERCVEATLRLIAAASAEREAPPARAARRRLGEVYGTTRLSRWRERLLA